MKTSNKGIEIIKKYEGFSAKSYICPAGFKTIGYGHLINKNEDLTEVSSSEAEELLLKDLISAEQAVMRNININLTQEQFDSLVSFTFNLGAAALQRSTLRQKVNRADHEEAASEFKRWVFSNGLKLEGLVRRRNHESALYLS